MEFILRTHNCPHSRLWNLMEQQASRARNIGAMSHLAYFSLSTGDKTDLTDKTPVNQIRVSIFQSIR